MKRRIVCGLFLTVAVTSGCASSSQLLRASTISTRSDVFQELADGGSVPQGSADLRVVASLKTHRSDRYPSGRGTHGTPDYQLVLNIDGQVTWLRASLKEEYGEAGGMTDPEAGEGIRYRFKKDFRLKAGTYRIIVAVPEDGVVVERTITLVGGSTNDLVLEPIYGIVTARKPPAVYSRTSFLEGLRGLAMVLNGERS